MRRANNFEHLTNAQNDNVNHEWNKWKIAFDENKVTEKECDYFFQKWVMKNFTEKESFLICTNRQSFNKIKGGE